MRTIDDILVGVKLETIRATKLHGTFNSFHEGFAILNEEVDELWDEVKASKGHNSTNKKELFKEAIQVAAMATRFVLDLLQKDD